MANASVQVLRNTDPNVSPTNLKEGQLAINTGVSPSVDNLKDIYIFIGTGNNDRIDSEGNDLSSTVVGSVPLDPTKGWVRFSLQPYVIDAGEF